MSEDIKGKQGYIEVQSTIAGLTKKDRKPIKVAKFETATANVGVSLGHSFEQADGSWAKIQCSVNLPCYVEEVVDVFRTTGKLVERLMDEEMERLGGE